MGRTIGKGTKGAHRTRNRRPQRRRRRRRHGCCWLPSSAAGKASRSFLPSLPRGKASSRRPELPSGPRHETRVVGGSEPEERETGNADRGFSRKDGDEGHWALGRGHVAESGSEDVRTRCGRTVRMRGGPGLWVMELPLKAVEQPSVVQRRNTIALGCCYRHCF